MEKFRLGRTVATPGVLDAIGTAGVTYLLMLHASGNFGDICESDRAINAWAIRNGERVVSEYEKMFPQKVYVVTERDRSVTTVLLASEY